MQSINIQGRVDAGVVAEVALMLQEAELIDLDEALTMSLLVSRAFEFLSTMRQFQGGERVVNESSAVRILKSMGIRVGQLTPGKKRLTGVPSAIKERFENAVKANRVAAATNQEKKGEFEALDAAFEREGKGLAGRTEEERKAELAEQIRVMREQGLIADDPSVFVQPEAISEESDDWSAFDQAAEGEQPAEG